MKLNLTQASEIEGVPSLSTLKRHRLKGKFTVDQDDKGDPVIDLSELARAYNITIDKNTGEPVQKTTVNHNDPTQEHNEPVQNPSEPVQSMAKIELEFERKQKEFYKEQLNKVEKDRDHWRDQAERLAITHQVVTQQHESATKSATEVTAVTETAPIPQLTANKSTNVMLIIILLLLAVITTVLLTM